VSDTETTRKALTQSLVDQLAASAVEGRVSLEEVQDALGNEESDEDLEEDEVDISELLAALLARGIEVVDEEIENDSVEEDFAYIAKFADASELDALSLYRREAGHHRILSREEETEKTTRIAFLRRTYKAFLASEKRLEGRLEATDRHIAETNELIEIIGAESDTDPELLVEPRAALVAAGANRAKLVTDIAHVVEEREAAEAELRRARTDFLGYNLKLVLACARRNHQQSGRRVDLLDLIQQGNMGMLEAVDKFDPSRGYKFSTFATWHIRQKISEFSHEQRGAIKVPTHRHRDIRKINAFRRTFFEQYGEHPSEEQIGEHMGRSVKKVREILDAETKANPFSLDQTLGPDDDSATMNDFIPDTSAPLPEQAMVREALGKTIRSAFLRDLNPRERRVLQLRFALYDEGRTWTLEEIGKRLGVTRERVRQIEAKALSKLRVDPEIREVGDRDEDEGYAGGYRMIFAGGDEDRD
jgi:RNA polymerase primary sigma factor